MLLNMSVGTYTTHVTLHPHNTLPRVWIQFCISAHAGSHGT